MRTRNFGVAALFAMVSAAAAVTAAPLALADSCDPAVHDLPG